jgi:hypothetical protein
MALKRRMRDGTIKYITYKHEEDNQSDNKDKDLDLEIKRLEAIIEILESKIKQLETDKPKEESSDVMGYKDKPIAAASTYDCYG